MLAAGGQEFRLWCRGAGSHFGVGNRVPRTRSETGSQADRCLRGWGGTPATAAGAAKGGGYLMACSTATATATEAPTMGLLPMPMSPIISTWAGTEEEPANWASECMRPRVSVMP